MGDHNIPVILQIAKGIWSDVFRFFPDETILKDAAYYQKRCEQEGIQFVTQAIPLLGKAVETSLVTLTKLEVPASFALHHNDSLPRFMHGLFTHVFFENGFPRYDRRDAFRRECATSATALRCIRQICLLFSKYRVEPSQSQISAAAASFKERLMRFVTPSPETNQLAKARKLLREVLLDQDGGLAPELRNWQLCPWGRHGPGAVESGEDGVQRWKFTHFEGQHKDLFKWTSDVDLEGYKTPTGSSRACFVPKDFRGPRTICIESKEFQFAQQGLMDCLYRLCARKRHTRNEIDFTDQTKSRRLCQNYGMATIDLKDASDLLSTRAVKLLFPQKFLRLVGRYRSRGIKLPDGVLTKYSAYATMGNALCFPIETLAFWAIAKSVGAANDPVRVFGDDIIVTRRNANRVIRALESYGLVINKAKTCVDSPIRESCGAWVYLGYDTSIVTIKGCDYEHASQWLAGFDQAVLFQENEWSETANSICELLNQHWSIPFGYFGLPAKAGWDIRASQFYRWNSDLQRGEYRLPSVCEAGGTDRFSTYAGLYAWAVKSNTHPVRHPGVVKTRIVWKELLRRSFQR